MVDDRVALMVSRTQAGSIAESTARVTGKSFTSLWARPFAHLNAWRHGY